MLWDLVGRRLSFLLEPEAAHRAAIKGLASGVVRVPLPQNDPRLAVRVAGLTFANPLGVAAGFDKNAEVPDALLANGFGFTEIGTVTPLPQAGNPQPRVFRLPDDEGVINRLGFNNEGHDAAYRRLTARVGKPGIVGVNIGANKDAEDRIADYVTGIARFHALASYFTVNISSPNTPGLRNLQARSQLADLLRRVMDARSDAAANDSKTVPVFLKIAPDVSEEELDDIAAEVLDKKLDGIIVSNTTLSRVGLKTDPAEAGGLSGKPVFERSTIMLAKTRQRVGTELALIGVGGVDDAASAADKIAAGADLVQLYTGMIYRGPGVAADIVRGLSTILDERKLGSITAMRDTATADWASRPLP